ncbi:GNAT family N-acetyltransferase [Palleronia caenipelagi]|uniref:L-ornithine N(alpha)-acyltransferase n=1 Tax=Palleronia caenipelagi TaxID=2489174 RepID=A0A547PXY1_9RHOB|nr:GNAT family N-acetyltransferase [Palleronia caenipelagi]TRD18974.1 GNAT family N-acetyltransferase [Palleronia caenipelagi]
MVLLSKGRYRVIEAETADQIAHAMALRLRIFPVDAAGPDPYDQQCRHILIEDIATGEVVCTYRLRTVHTAGEVDDTYSARYYGLGALRRFNAPMVELGRFCIDPDRCDGDILRVAWGALTRIVDRDGVGMLFGCASFQGTDAAQHADAFALLHARHEAPVRWRPRVKAPRIFQLASALRGPLDPRRAMAAMPPLLRTYLTMGGWVSDHAVVDEEMGTMHVFTGVEIRAIPPARQRLLRAVAV